MGKEQYIETRSELISQETKKNLAKWGKRLALVAIALIGLSWML